MTKKEIINKVYGEEYESYTKETKSLIDKLITWMKVSLGILDEDPIDRDGLILKALQIASFKVFGISYDDIMKPSRKREMSDKRAMIFKVARELSTSKPITLAKYFPSRSRCLTMYDAVQKASDLIDTDKKFRKEYDELITSTEYYLESLYNKSCQ